MEQTRAYIERAQKGDAEAKKILVEQNMGLVWSVAKRFSGKGYDLEDLAQIGTIGLLKCIDKFDLCYDVKFSTYAVPMILGEIRRFFRDDGMVKVSRPLKELYIKAIRAKEDFQKQKGRTCTIQELANLVSVSVEELMQALEAGQQVESLSQTLYENKNGETVSLQDRIGAAEEEEQIVNRLCLEELLHVLPPREKQVMVLRYCSDKTQSEIAKILGISQVQVSRIEKRVLLQMRAQMEKK